jgi:PIN domain nuclease of toxin-antitoxin system
MTGVYLLDTCAWLDAFIAPQKLKPEVRALINQQSTFSIADITLLEVARKAEVGDLILEATIER